MNGSHILLVWDCRRKPIWDTMEDQIVVHERTGKKMHIASFSTEPMLDVVDYKIYSDAMKKYIGMYGGKPITVEDFANFRNLLAKRKYAK